MNTLRLVRIVKEIEVVDKQLAALKSEAGKILAESGEATGSKPKPAPLSAAQRKKISLAMKKRWAEVRKKLQTPAGLKNDARKTLAGSEEAADSKPKPAPLSAAQRKKISLAMKKRWAEVRRKQQAQAR